MDRANTRAALANFLHSVARTGRTPAHFEDDTNLVQAGVIDSFAVIQIIAHLEQQYDVNLHAIGVDPTDLVSLGGMLSAIERARR